MNPNPCLVSDKNFLQFPLPVFEWMQQVCNGLLCICTSCCQLLHLLRFLKWYIYFPPEPVSQVENFDLPMGRWCFTTHPQIDTCLFRQSIHGEVPAGCRFCPFTRKWGWGIISRTHNGSVLLPPAAFFLSSWQHGAAGGQSHRGLVNGGQMSLARAVWLLPRPSSKTNGRKAHLGLSGGQMPVTYTGTVWVGEK